MEATLPAVHPSEIVEWNDRFFIHDEILEMQDYPEYQRRVGGIVRVTRGTGKMELFFEIVGIAQEPGRPITEHGWELRRVVPEDEFRDLPVTHVCDAR